MKDFLYPRNPVASHIRGIPRSGIRDFFDIVSRHKDVISMSIGEPDFVTPWHIREASIYALNQGATSYTANTGLVELRNAIADYVGGVYGLEYSPDSEIMVTVGVSEALDLAVRAVVEPGDEVLYHEPCYVSYGPVIRFAHGIPVPVETSRGEDFRLTAGRLREKITPRSRLLLLNFPCNPTGSILQDNDLEEIAKLAVEHDLIVVTDEIYSELTFDGVKHSSIAGFPGMKDRTIFMSGFSKAWAMTGFRLGFTCAPKDLTEAMMKIHQYTMLCAPILAQKAAIEALKHGRADIDRMRNEYEMRRNFVHSSLNGMGLSCHLPRGAFYAFPSVQGYGLSSKEFALKLINEQRVACVPGDAFGGSGEGFLRCSFATATNQIKEAMKRMAQFVSGLEKK